MPTFTATLQQGIPIPGGASAPEETAIAFTIDGGGVAIAAGRKGYASIPFDGTITGWAIVADLSGSISIDISKKQAAVPNTTTDKISASAPVALASAQLHQDGSLAGWTTAIAADDVLGYNVTAATAVTQVTVTLQVLR